jgi:hypothetical protein
LRADPLALGRRERLERGYDQVLPHPSPLFEIYRMR